MVDTHAHLSVCEPDTARLVADARAAGVRRILEVGMGPESNPAALEAARAHEEVFACVGRHPNSAEGFDDADAEELAALVRGTEVVAVGETGLDYHRDRSPRKDQRRAFDAQIEIARDVQKPLVIHMRESLDDTFEVLRERADGVTVILHCFSAPEAAGEAAEHGWYCSFAGNVTYPKSEKLRGAAARVPDELLLVETDSPFLSPQPQRGKPNQPANVVDTAAVVAEVRGVEYAEVERLVEDNARRAFGW